MMPDARDGLIDKIIVKKYDRFNRNMREYLNVTDRLDKYGVGVVSLSEPFNTETKEGKMMRNNLLNFAEFERETIATRVPLDYSGKIPYVFELSKIPASYYFVFLHLAFDYLKGNGEVMGRVENLAWNYDISKFGGEKYEWNEDVCQCYHRYYHEITGYPILRPIKLK